MRPARIARKASRLVRKALGLDPNADSEARAETGELRADLQGEIDSCNQALAAAASLRELYKAQLAQLERTRQEALPAPGQPNAPTSSQEISPKARLQAKIDAEEKELLSRLAEAVEKCDELAQFRESVIRRARGKLS